MDYYKTLGLIPNAEPAVIKAAYRALVSIYHPDKNNDESSNNKIKDINAAYAVLSNPTKKSEYDSQIEKDKSNASTSAFSTSDPFYSDPLENDWEMAIDFYPELKEQYDTLSKISWRLAFAFKLQLLDSQNFKESQQISQKMKFDYLSKYFGNDKEIIKYAELLITNRAIDAALYLNSIVKIMGQSVDKCNAENRVNKKHPELRRTLAEQQTYSNLKRGCGNDYATVAKLVELNGGSVKESLFSPKVTVQLNNKEYKFKNVAEFGQFALKIFSSKYDV